MKKLLLMLIVFSVFPAVFYGNATAERTYKDVPENSIIKWATESALSKSDLGFDIILNSYSGLVKNSDGRIVRNSVQDVLDNEVYESFNKGYTRFQQITISPGGEAEEVEAVVLFNLDIYSYFETEKDPVTDLERRIGYSKETYLTSPLVLHININDLNSVLNKKLNGNAEGEVYYFEPGSSDSKEGWYPIENLVTKGDIDYSVENGVMTVIIYKWPKDDRVHVGL